MLVTFTVCWNWLDSFQSFYVTEVTVCGTYHLCYVLQIQVGYSDVAANTLYDVLHDPHYRKSWDPYILEGFDICRISPNSDIGYYASECFCLSLMYVKMYCELLYLIIFVHHFKIENSMI